MRIDAELAARGAGLPAFYELFDDSAHRFELLPVRGRRLRRNRKLRAPESIGKRGASGLLGVAKKSVPLPRKALLELDHGAANSGTPAAQGFERAQDVVFRAKVFESLGQRDARFAKDLAAAGLAPQVLQLRIHSVQRNSEQDGEPALQRRRVEHGQERAVRVADAVTNPLDQAGAFQDLLGQGTRRGVIGAEESEPRAGVARGDPREQLEVVLEDERVHRPRSDVHHARLRVPEPDQQEEKPLLVVARPFELLELARIEGQRRHDDRGVGLLFPRGESVPEVGEPRLDPAEELPLGFDRKVAWKRRFRNHGRPKDIENRPGLRRKGRPSLHPGRGCHN